MVIDGNCYDFIQKREKLLDQFIYLCRSLGFSCYKNECLKRATNGKSKKFETYYRCCVYGKGLEEIPILLDRKKAEERKQVKRSLINGITLTKLGIQKNYKIITDKPRFLLSDFTVMHRYEKL